MGKQSIGADVKGNVTPADVPGAKDRKFAEEAGHHYEYKVQGTVTHENMGKAGEGSPSTQFHY
jgi:hypothetical protein